MRFILLGILLALPAFFNAAEVALLRLRPSRAQSLFEEGKPGSRTILRLQKRLRRALLVAQLGITLSLISLGWVSKTWATQFWDKEISNSQFWYLLFLVVVVLTSTLISGVFPKALVLNNPEISALKLSPLLESVMKWMAPFLSLIEKVTSLIIRLIGLNPKWDSLVTALSAGELETLIESGAVTGLEPNERNILEGVFALRDTQVREVMVPRSGMVTLSKNACFSELMEEVHRTRHSRFLVIDDSLDNVLGQIDLRHLAEAISHGSIKANTSIIPYINSVPKVLETLTLAELLPLIKQGNPFLLVVDEYGGTEGLITSADLTGEIVGDEIQSDNKEPDLFKIESTSNQWIANGDLEIIDLNRQLKVELPEADDHYTLAGFLLEKLQEVPSNGESLLFEQIVFQIISMKGPRINQVKITLPDNSINDH